MPGGIWGLLITTFLASSVEAVEMATIVLGVGATRGWRSTAIGAIAGFAVLLAVGGGLGTGLRAIPIDILRLVVGALLLIFGMQWLRTAVPVVAAEGLTVQGGEEEEQEAAPGTGGRGMDWTAFVLAFKGVLLEGLEIAFIVVSFGAGSGRFLESGLSGVAALVVIGGIGAAFHGALERIPRRVLQLAAGTLLVTFGTFWAVEGLSIHWPLGDLAIAALFVFYAGSLTLLILGARARRAGLAPVGGAS